MQTLPMIAADLENKWSDYNVQAKPNDSSYRATTTRIEGANLLMTGVCNPKNISTITASRNSIYQIVVLKMTVFTFQRTIQV